MNSLAKLGATAQNGGLAKQVEVRVGFKQRGN